MAEPLTLAGEFPAASIDEWREAVNKVLARKDKDLSDEELARRFQKVLVAHTYDGIDINPLYTAEDLPEAAGQIGQPGSWPFVRGAEPLGPAPAGWDVRQAVDLGAGTAEANRIALDHLTLGGTSLLLRAGAGVDFDTDGLDAALDGVHLDLAAVALEPSVGIAGARALLGLLDRRQVDPAGAAGTLGLDPLGVAASTGAAVADEDIKEAADVARTVAATWPGIRSWVVDATRYHDAGAADADELAFATATGIEYLRWLTEAGLSLTAALGELEFRLAATSDQFATIAKLRAGRRLWARVAEYLGAADAGAQHQHAVSSRAMLTRYDPWVNLLRNTVAAFAAGVGGATSVTVDAHDLLSGDPEPTELGRRMARNTQLLLIEESHLARVIDPGAGSWYLEWLTDAMAEKAWQTVQEIEAAGGMRAALGGRLVQDRIETTWSERSGRLARRADTMVGINDFPNPEDRAGGSGPLPDTDPPGGLPRRRYARSFESLRERVDAHELASGLRPAVLIARLGPAAASSARSTWIHNFFGTGGLRIVEHDLDLDAGSEGLRRALSEAGGRLVCLCSSDELYGEDGERAVALLAGAGAARVYAATAPGRVGDPLVAAGVDELVYSGCDVLDAVTRALAAVEVP